MFRIQVLGNLGADAEIKQDNGRTYVQFSVADTRRFKREDGTETEVTNWFSCFMRNADSEVVKYLKKGTKVYVSGNGELRVYSSAKDRMMKAGASINVTVIELAGGTSDDVPREVAADTGQLFAVSKYYWTDLSKVNPKPTILYDRRGNHYDVDDNGFITSGKAAAPQENAAAPQEKAAAPQEQQQIPF